MDNAIFELGAALVEMLTQTWPGRIALGMAAGAILTRIARN